MLPRRTVSTESPSTFPTTGINVLLAVFSPFIVSPSTLLVSVPSSEIILTNIVSTNPSTHTILDFNILDSFPICILSDKLDTIPSTVAIRRIGKKYSVIPLPIKTIAPKITGCITLAVTAVPVVITNANKSGINIFMYPTKLVIVVFTKSITFVKLLISCYIFLHLISYIFCYIL